MNKYRFKTKTEFVKDKNWANGYDVPGGWGADKSVNSLLGTLVPDQFIADCDKNKPFSYKGIIISHRDYVLLENEQKATNSSYRLKTKEEFIADGLWKYNPNIVDGGHPQDWENHGLMNKYLGKDIPEIFVENCKKEKSFQIEGWNFRSLDYVLKQNVYYRFLTKEEFQDKDMWIEDFEIEEGGYPNGWSNAMNEYLGQRVPVEVLESCENSEEFTFEGWQFAPDDYVLEEDVVAQNFSFKEYELVLIPMPNYGGKNRIPKKGDIVLNVNNVMRRVKTEEGIPKEHLKHWSIMYLYLKDKSGVTPNYFYYDKNNSLMYLYHGATSQSHSSIDNIVAINTLNFEKDKQGFVPIGVTPRVSVFSDRFLDKYIKLYNERNHPNTIRVKTVVNGLWDVLTEDFDKYSIIEPVTT